MSFMDIVKSSFYGQYKAHSRALTTGVEGKNTRIKNKAQDRQSKRFDAFISNRGLENEMEMASQSVASATENVDVRKKQMLLWREERLRRKKMEPKKPPPFKAGVVTHTVVPFQEPIFKKNLKSVTDTTNTVRRVTRAATRAQNEETSHKPSAKDPILMKSFAPIGAKFHAPKIVIKERKPTKCTPKLRNTGRIFSKFFSKNNSSSSKASVKRSTKAGGGSQKSSAKKKRRSQSNNVRKSLPRKIFAEDMSCENSPNPKKTTLSKSNTTTPTASNGSSDSNTELTVTSPFVTLGRGKGNRQRESICKLKFGYGESSPEKSASYLRTQLDEEVTRLRGLCDVWKNYQEENDSELSEESTDLINLAIGQTQLLMNKKLQQFRGLIDQCENKEKRVGEGIVTVEDLQGFWDMVFMQVVNVDVRFKRLDELKMKNWQEDDLPCPEVTKKIVVPKSKPTAKNPKSSIALKAMIQAARIKSKQDSEKPPPIIDTLSVEPDNMVTFDGIFFSVVSPSKNTDALRMSRSPARSPMLKSVVTSEAKKRITSTTSNAMAVMRASSAARSDASRNETAFTDDQISFSNTSMDLKKTPGKSILKTPGTNKKPLINRRSVKVIFYESNDDSSEGTNERTQSEAAESAEEKSPEIKKIVRGSKRTKIQPKDENSHPLIHATSNQKRKTRRGRRSNSGIPLNENIVENDLDESQKDLNTSKRISRSSASDIKTAKVPLLAVSPFSTEDETSPKRSIPRRLTRKRSVGERKSINLITFDSPDGSAPVARRQLRR